LWHHRLLADLILIPKGCIPCFWDVFEASKIYVIEFDQRFFQGDHEKKTFKKLQKKAKN